MEVFLQQTDVKQELAIWRNHVHEVFIILLFYDTMNYVRSLYSLQPQLVTLMRLFSSRTLTYETRNILYNYGILIH